MVILNDRCEVTEGHTHHEVTILQQVTCSGMTDCGLYSHDPHEIEVELSGWCPGVCDCGFRKTVHSPGDHK